MTGLTGNNAITGAGYRKNQPPYEIDQSLRFNDGDSAYLNRTAGTATSNDIGTLSFWAKRGEIGGGKAFFSNHSDANNRTYVGFDSDTIQMYGKISGSTNVELVTTPVFRDPSAWYHIVIAVDVTQSTESNRVKIYVNGSQVTDFSTSTYPAQNTDLPLFSKTNMQVGAFYSSSVGDYYDGYLAEYNYIDGQALTPASFGETLASTNQWVPIAYEGSYGANGFYLPFSATELANSFTDSSKSSLDTSNRSSEITVTSSFSWEFTSSGDATGEFLVNGDLTNDDTNGWMPSGSVSGRTVKFDFGTAKTYTKAQYVSINSSADDGTWKWQGSNNDSDWTDIGSSFTLGGNDPSSNTFYDLTELSGNTTAYRYYRILGVSGTANTSGRRLAMYFGGWSDGVGHTITASGDVVHTRAQKKIGSSSIKFDGTGDYLTAPDSSDWDVFGSSSDNWTIDFFVKHTDHAGGETYLSQSEDSSNYWQLAHYHSGGLWFGVKSGGSWIIDSTDGGYGPEITDTNWHHVALCKVGQEYGIYLDGAQGEYISDSSTDTFSALLAIGTSTWDGTNRDFDGYMDEIRIQSSNVFSASPNVGKTDTITVPTSAHTADANTKLLIHSDFNGGIGADSSGNTNDFSATNLVATDVVGDSPTNNFCTLNPLNLVTNTTLSEGNLKADCTSSNDGAALGTMSVSSGKWYWEVLQTTANANNDISMGVMELSRKMAPQGVGTDVYPNAYLYGNDGWNAKYNSTTSTINTYGAGDIIGWALDLDGNTLKIYKNNSLEYTYSSGVSGTFTPLAAVDGTSGQSVTHIANFGQDSSFNGEKTAQGNGGTGEDFYYSPPAGFKALNTYNLSDPSIADPTAHFDTALYTGNGSTQTISSLNFQPDLVWTKPRSISSSPGLTDSVRGAGRSMKSNDTASERPVSGSPGATDDMYAFTSNGFSVGTDNYLNINQNTVTYASWNWKAGGTASTNEDGSIDSLVSANTDAGFSIVGWTGTGSNVTVGHGLSQAPELIINKSRGDAYNWAMQSFLWNSASDTNLLYLNTTAGTADDTNVFQAAPTSTVFSPQGGSWAGIGANTIEYIAYCVHSVDGYSMVGKYGGNGAQDGSFVYTGFRPAFIFIKRITSSGSNSYIIDNKRIGYNHFVYATDVGSNKYLWPDSSAAEGNGDSTKGIGMDILSNGFKFRTNSSDYQSSSNDYLFYAIAESPFKYSNAR